MEEKNYTGVIPEHHDGKIIDVVQTVELETEEEARNFYQSARNHLLEVNGWHSLAGTLSAEFQLVDAQGQEVYRQVEEGDHFRIDIPGPGSTAGDGYDWVKVEQVRSVTQEDVESTGIRVRPVPSPLNAKEDVAHFYSSDSTSSFTVTREGRRVTVGIYDRNTKPNTDVHTVVDTIRDAAVGTTAVGAFSKIQWKSLADGILKTSE